ncbi:hypothetical protein ACFY2W_08575 [Streptomyces sp. NPDC001262]|uniref:hypothetical protein n=1 Tax=Streptomyces sp. NPDC001262 TaxID=3364552 RepID=UPI0036B1E013
MNVTAKPSGSRGRSRLRPLLAGAPWLLACAVFLTVFQTSRTRLPDPIATHFVGSGRADGFTSPGTFQLQGLGLLLGLAVLFVALGYVTGTPRPLVVIAWATVGLLSFVLVQVVLGNAGAESARQVRLAPWQLLAALGVAAVAGGVGLLVTRGWYRAEPGAGVRKGAGHPPGLALRPGETAFWTHTQVSRGFGIAGLVVLALGATLIPLTGAAPGIVLLVAGLTLALFSGMRTTVDRHGLTVAMLWLPWPRLRIPLEHIAEATAQDVDALRDMGGWGYRVRRGRSGIVLRSGEALVVRRAHGSEFVVTTDDAARAAALLNGLVERGRGHAAPTDRRG